MCGTPDAPAPSVAIGDRQECPSKLAGRGCPASAKHGGTSIGSAPPLAAAHGRFVTVTRKSLILVCASIFQCISWIIFIIHEQVPHIASDESTPGAAELPVCSAQPVKGRLDVFAGVRGMGLGLVLCRLTFGRLNTMSAVAHTRLSCHCSDGPRGLTNLRAAVLPGWCIRIVLRLDRLLAEFGVIRWLS